MGISVESFGFSDLRRKLNGGKEVADDIIIKRRLEYIGEQLCAHARTVTKSRSDGGFDDQTGNLRSSIGYRLYKDGEVVSEGGFQAGFGKEGGTEGIDSAKKALGEYGLAHGISNINGWTLIIVAGMHYAYYVQEKYGYNVLRLTEIEMRKLIQELRQEFNLK